VKKTATRVKHFGLRLQPSLMEEAKRIAKAQGVAVNQLINAAVAEKVSALRTEEFLRNAPPRVSSRKRFKFSRVPERGIRRFLATTRSQRECVVAVSPPSVHPNPRGLSTERMDWQSLPWVVS